MTRVKEPRGYISPNREEVRAKAQEAGLKAWSPEFVADLANLAAGGEVKRVSDRKAEIREPSRQMIHKSGRPSRPWTVRFDDYETYQEALGVAEDFVRSRESSIKEFLSGLDMASQIGNTPLEKACNLLKVLSEAGGEPREGDGAGLPVFSNAEKASKMANAVNEAIDTAENMDEIEKDLLDSSDESADDSDLKRVSRACMMANHAKRVMIDLARNLDKISKLRVSRSIKVTPDPEGDDVRRRPIRGFHEVGKISASEWAMPAALRNYKILTGQILVREKVSRQDKKQLIYLLIDCSGSMDCEDRIAQAAGVLLNRLKAVGRGSCELWLSYFDDHLRSTIHIVNKEEAKSLLSDSSDAGNYSGGGTSIGYCVNKAQERIDEILADRSDLDRPEILVVTDGDDEVDPDRFPSHTKVHAFVVGGRTNSGLKGLVKNTGGVYLEL